MFCKYWVQGANGVVVKLSQISDLRSQISDLRSQIAERRAQSADRKSEI